MKEGNKLCLTCCRYKRGPFQISKNILFSKKNPTILAAVSLFIDFLEESKDVHGIDFNIFPIEVHFWNEENRKTKRIFRKKHEWKELIEKPKKRWT